MSHEPAADRPRAARRRAATRSPSARTCSARAGKLSRSCRAAAAPSSSATRPSRPCMRAPRRRARGALSEGRRRPRCPTAKRTRPGRRCRRSSTRCWRRAATAARPCSRSAAAWSAISPASPRPATCAASPTSRCRRRCSPRSTPRSAARPAINHPSGKNMIGAFHQPLAVVADVDVLEYAARARARRRAGRGHQVRRRSPTTPSSPGSRASLPALLARDKPSLVQAVTRSCHIKAQVVASDERESGLRAILNFGHTFAPCDRDGHRARQLAAWRGGRLRHGDGGRSVGAPRPDRAAHAARIARIVGRRRPAVARARARRRRAISS